MRTLLGLAGVALLAGCPAPIENCSNGVDDNGDGLVDCADPTCSAQCNQDAGFFGTCQLCGQACTTQNDCISGQYVSDHPVPVCVASKCQALNTYIQVRLDLDTKASWSGLGITPQSAASRFILPTAQDGSAVTCAVLTAAAADKLNPSSLEQVKKFQILGLDVTKLGNPNLGQGVPLPLVNTATSDGHTFLIWEELWSGLVDSQTKMPSGRRYGYGCFEAAADVGGPLVATDDCTAPGTCRDFKLVMPAPQP